MTHIVEVDQSGKIGDTKTSTVVAFSNKIQFSVIVPSHVKRNCITLLRKQGFSGKYFYTQLFTITLFLLLKNHISQKSNIKIDNEYEGQEATIKDILLNLFAKKNINLKPHQINFVYIGKKSNAHKIALETLRSKRKPNKTLHEEDLLQYFKKKKSGPSLGRKPS